MSYYGCCLIRENRREIKYDTGKIPKNNGFDWDVSCTDGNKWKDLSNVLVVESTGFLNGLNVWIVGTGVIKNSFHCH